MTIIYGQYDKATKTEIAFGATYNADCQVGNLIKSLKRVQTVCFGSNNGGLSFGPYKQVVAAKLMNNYSNNKPHDPHSFKVKVKIKYDVIKAVAGRFPNRTAVMIEFLAAAPPPIDWAGYCRLTSPKQLVWEERSNNLNKAMFS